MINFIINLIKDTKENIELKNKLKNIIQEINSNNLEIQDELFVKFINLFKNLIENKLKNKEINDIKENIQNLNEIKVKILNEINEIDDLLKNIFEDTKMYLENN
jgi:phage terminase small subunit